eukprot:3894727-Alexandrium_andersonii.AAC.1
MWPKRSRVARTGLNETSMAMRLGSICGHACSCVVGARLAMLGQCVVQTNCFLFSWPERGERARWQRNKDSAHARAWAMLWLRGQVVEACAHTGRHARHLTKLMDRGVVQSSPKHNA